MIVDMKLRRWSHFNNLFISRMRRILIQMRIIRKECFVKKTRDMNSKICSIWSKWKTWNFILQHLFPDIIKARCCFIMTSMTHHLLSSKSLACHENRDMRRRINTISVWLSERHHCHTIRRSSSRKISWLRSTIRNDCCLCMQIWSMRHEFFMTEKTSYKKTMTTVMTLDQKTTLSYASRQSTESQRWFIHLNCLTWIRSKLYEVSSNNELKDDDEAIWMSWKRSCWMNETRSSWMKSERE
jgi:hypothetical protein